MNSFSPDPDLASKVLDDLTSVRYSMEQVAHIHDTTTDLLLAWLARPDIAERLASHTSAAAARTRMVAACNMTDAVRSVVYALSSYTQAERDDALKPSLQTFLFEEARRVNARRAAATLLRLARYFPTLVPTTAPIPTGPRPAHERAGPETPEPRIHPLQLTAPNTPPTSTRHGAAAPGSEPQPSSPESPGADVRSAAPKSDIPHPTSDLPNSPSHRFTASPSHRTAAPAPVSLTQSAGAAPSGRPAFPPALRFADLSFEFSPQPTATQSPASNAPGTAMRFAGIAPARPPPTPTL